MLGEQPEVKCWGHSRRVAGPPKEMAFPVREWGACGPSRGLTGILRGGQSWAGGSPGKGGPSGSVTTGLGQFWLGEPTATSTEGGFP